MVVLEDAQVDGPPAARGGKHLLEYTSMLYFYDLFLQAQPVLIAWLRWSAYVFLLYRIQTLRACNFNDNRADLNFPYLGIHSR